MDSTISSSKIKLGLIASLLFAVSPIMDPYILLNLGSFTLRLMDLPILLFLGYVLLAYRKFPLPNRELVILLIILFSLTLFSFFYGTENRSFTMGIKVLIIWFVYTVIVSNMWGFYSYEKFIKYAIRIAIIGTVLLMIQFIAISLGFLTFFDGKIPFLKLSEYDQWAGLIDPNTGDIRVSSFFQEPSYYGIYCLPVFAQLIKEQKFKLSLFIFIGIVLSSSLIAVIGGLIVASFILVTNKEQGKKRTKFIGKFLAVIGIAFIMLLLLYLTNSNFQNVIQYTVNRISVIGEELNDDRYGSAKIRLLGYVDYIAEYPLFLKIFGAGASQYPLLLAQYGILPYSSTAVTMMLNYGIIGFLIFILGLLLIFFKSKPSKRGFVLIFILICFSDNFWFNWYFFYILSWFLPFIASSKKSFGII